MIATVTGTEEKYTINYAHYLANNLHIDMAFLGAVKTIITEPMVIVIPTNSYNYHISSVVKSAMVTPHPTHLVMTYKMLGLVEELTNLKISRYFPEAYL